ncbi:MAG: lipopolysaccharide assembly protein LapB, partial [Halieaceae bacterium]|nr:lipopolysaccharide assembly protein LapB [Halieaceae bacterium]
TPLMREAMDSLGVRKNLRSYLEGCFERTPTTPLALAIAHELHGTIGNDAAKKFLRLSLKDKPSLRGVALLMSLHDSAEAGDDESLELETIEKIIDQRSSYRCTHCGFRSQQLHWYCPGCKHWGTIRDLGTTGEALNG